MTCPRGASIPSSDAGQRDGARRVTLLGEIGSLLRERIGLHLVAAHVVAPEHVGVIWEKKVAASACLHFVNDQYTWSVSGSAPDGTAFTSFLNTLNGGATGVGNCTSADGIAQAGGFNNHCDWRLPTIAELRTIVDLSAAGCGSGSPCIDPIFGPTGASPYWSSTTFANNPSDAWIKGFFDGSMDAGVGDKSIVVHNIVRAVRGGS